MLRLNPLVAEGTSVRRMRESLNKMGDTSPRMPSIVIDEVKINGVSVFHFRPEKVSCSGKIMLYLHGGGYVMGSSRSHRPLLEYLSSFFKVLLSISSMFE